MDFLLSKIALLFSRLYPFIWTTPCRIRKNYYEGDNYKSTTAIILEVLFILFITVGQPEILTAADGTTAEQVVKKEMKQQKNSYATAQITTKIIPSANKTFGYDILLNGKPLVHQPNIPGLPGNDGFATKEMAQKVADFVVKKIRNNEMPPTVITEDLSKMDVLKKD